MIKQKIGNHTVEVYDSIDELPIVRFHKYNKFLLIDAGIGSDINSMDEHIIKAMSLAKNDTDAAVLELQNMRQAIYMVNAEISPKYLAFAALVYSIDGKAIYDISDDNLQKVHNQLKSAKVNEVDCLMETVKKKIDTELLLYFPQKFETSGVKEFYDDIKKRVELALDDIIDGTDNSKAINALDDKLIGKYKPKAFYGSESAEIQYNKNFEDMCLLLDNRLHVQSKRMTTMEFYNAFEYLRKIDNKSK